MANLHRGDVDLNLAGGPMPLRLTLGALAEIETAFGASGLIDLGERLKLGRIGTRDMITILAAAARGAGGRLNDRDFANAVSAADMANCVAALGHLFEQTFGPMP